MSEPEQRSLTKAEIQDYFRDNGDFFFGALRQAQELVDGNREAEASAHVPVPVDTLRSMHQAMTAMYKIMGDQEMLPPFGNHGNRGPGSDWNPLTPHGVDIGDLNPFG
ncbi:hypothetical protein [Planomonospora parontospora]|uniref:hypothetical protein n=1 Tax=Planomonospora parontospora TaxID=58119 RepID=UPI0016707B48|nr:hypothetical protein [Planomonospora parontospora]GGL48961.1 hypothetical protein GCM10014719_57750 [Planomonospora parontospora subsp. antibiotica]GII18914.1 hypothetical protein Ppa05_56400 [Planomonospora parontospora subsp. antibiotica]